MKIRLHKNWTPVVDTYQLTKADIEFQMMENVRKYREIYIQKYGKAPGEKLDIDKFVELLWGFQIVFMELESKNDEEIWGYLDPEKKLIYVNPNCSQERINFTVAHEAGHLSLHLSMMSLENGIVTGWQNKPLPAQSKNAKKLNMAEKRLEWQANKYASSLLVPKNELLALFALRGYIKNNTLSDSLNIDSIYPEIKERFGISQKAFEIRLFDLSIPFSTIKIGNTKKLL